MTTVREFSSAGPCITLGTFIKQTTSSVFFIDRDGKPGRKSGHAVKCGLVHTEPCHSCRDHPTSQYPNGYDN